MPAAETIRAAAVFETMLESAITNAQLAMEAARGLHNHGYTARDTARQRRMNQMVDNQIIAIEETFSIFVAVTRREEMHQIPFPPIIHRDRTLLNFRNGYGQPEPETRQSPIESSPNP